MGSLRRLRGTGVGLREAVGDSDRWRRVDARPREAGVGVCDGDDDRSLVVLSRWRPRRDDDSGPGSVGVVSGFGLTGAGVAGASTGSGSGRMAVRATWTIWVYLSFKRLDACVYQSRLFPKRRRREFCKRLSVKYNLDGKKTYLMLKLETHRRKCSFQSGSKSGIVGRDVEEQIPRELQHAHVDREGWGHRGAAERASLDELDA